MRTKELIKYEKATHLKSVLMSYSTDLILEY